MNIGRTIICVVLLAGAQGLVCAATSESAKSDAERRKPLQRCDQLKDQAELDCLQKARERIVEARKKREGAADDKSKAGTASPKPEPAAQPGK